MALRDDKKFLKGLRNIFTRVAAMIAGDPYELVQSEFDALEIWCAKGKGVFFASDVTKEQREKYFARNPDHVSLWMTPAGKHLTATIDHFMKTKEDESGIPQFGFDDLKRLKIYLAYRFAVEADLSFSIVYNNPRVKDEMLDAVINGLYDNTSLERINGDSSQIVLDRLKRRHDETAPSTDENKVVCFTAWKNRKQPKPQ